MQIGPLYSDTTITLNCKTPNGESTAQKSLTITVTGQVSFSATPDTVLQGGASQISWNCQGPAGYYTSSSGTGFATGGALTNVVTINPLTTTDYTLACNKAAGGADTYQRTITVLSPSSALSAPASVILGHGQDSAVITWSGTNVSSCTLVGPHVGEPSSCTGSACAAEKNTSTGILTLADMDSNGDAVYTLSCAVPGGTQPADKVARIHIAPLCSASPSADPRDCLFKATPSTILLAESTALSWQCPTGPPADPSSAGTNFATGGATSNEGLTVTPSDTATYSLLCLPSQAQGDAVVTVLKPILTLTAVPPWARKNSSVALSWSAINITPGTCSLTGPGTGSGAPFDQDSGSWSTPALSTQAVYTLSCNAPSGRPSVTLIVNQLPKYLEQ